MWLVGCASPGAPQPPSLQLPRPVQDLSATRKGENVLLTWTPPTQTSDGANIKHAGPTLICRSTDPKLMATCGNPIATEKNTQVEHWTKATMVGRHDYTDSLPTALMQENPLGFATYALEDQNTHSKSDALSNQVRVSLAPTLPAPTDLQAKVTADGVLLSWPVSQSAPANPELSFLYRILRQTQEGKKPEMIVGEVPASSGETSFLDRNVDWGQTYSYRVAPITKVLPHTGEPLEIEGDDSPQASVVAHDVFPPATPTGLQAVFSGPGQKPFVDLTWAPNLEADIAGYNIYRHEAGTAPVKINQDVVKTPSFRDDKVDAGHEYFYSISSVDRQGNESERSDEASEKVPAT
jgi:hypothetical protein